MPLSPTNHWHHYTPVRAPDATPQHTTGTGTGKRKVRRLLQTPTPSPKPTGSIGKQRRKRGPNLPLEKRWCIYHKLDLYCELTQEMREKKGMPRTFKALCESLGVTTTWYYKQKARLLRTGVLGTKSPPGRPSSVTKKDGAETGQRGKSGCSPTSRPVWHSAMMVGHNQRCTDLS